MGGGTALQPEAPHQDAQAPCRICAVCLAVETAWHSGGNGGSKGAGQPGGSSGATAGTTSTPDTAMVLHGSGSGGGGPATPGTSGSGPIPELPFASALLTSSDYKVDVGEPSLGLESVVWQASLFIAVFIAFRRQPLHAACMKGHAQSKLLPHKRAAIPSSRSCRCAPAVPSLLCRPLQQQAGAAGLRTLCQRVPRSVRRRAGGHQGGFEDESASALACGATQLLEVGTCTLRLARGISYLRAQLYSCPCPWPRGKRTCACLPHCRPSRSQAFWTATSLAG